MQTEMGEGFYWALLVPVILALLFNTLIQGLALYGAAKLVGAEDVSYWKAYGAYWILFLISGFSMWIFGKAFDGILAWISLNVLGAWFLSYFFATSWWRALLLVIISEIIMFLYVLVIGLIWGMGLIALLAGLGAS
jgi:hypothetical protein